MNNKEIEAIKEQIAREIEEKRLHEEIVRALPLEDVEKIVLTSDILCYGPEPENGKEIGQELTIHRDGSVYLTHEFYCRSEQLKIPSKTEQRNIGSDAAAEIIQVLYAGFVDFLEFPVTDIGGWELQFVFSNGEIMSRFCSTMQKPDPSSKYLRKKLGFANLLAFDGNKKIRY